MTASTAFWSAYQVAEFPAGVHVEVSIGMLRDRRLLYPDMAELMLPPVTGTVLDFGCGPGHDTIEFLLAGAEHVYAADVSPRALESVRNRLAAHDLQGRATVIQIPADERWSCPRVNHIHAAGVLHHCTDPVRVLQRLRRSLRARAEIRLMVYAADSYFYRHTCASDPEEFRRRADADAPIAHAWTGADVHGLATAADLRVSYLGSYRHPGEDSGSGLSACYSMRIT